MKFLAILAVLLASASARAEPSDSAPSSAASSLLGEVEFREGSARLSGPGGSQLAAVATWAKAHLNALIVIDGHADARGMTAGDVRLSLARARLVRAQLIARGVSPDQIIVAAFGPETRRVARVTVWATRDRYRARQSLN
jgi:outer membrane protein OmpA-like peptidoglycan-associated protein